MINKILVLLVLSVFLVGCSGVSKEDYEGTWKRQGIYADGNLVSSAPATMILTKNTFSSFNDQCSNSGDLKVDGLFFVTTVKQSNCPSIIKVGTTVTSTYVVSGSNLNIINNEYGANVKEVYVGG